MAPPATASIVQYMMIKGAVPISEMVEFVSKMKKGGSNGSDEEKTRRLVGDANKRLKKYDIKIRETENFFVIKSTADNELIRSLAAFPPSEPELPMSMDDD